MITNEHNDGFCFKLIVTYSDSNYDGERIYTMYGEDEVELWAHFLEVRHMFAIVQEIKIQDDSK